MNYEKELYGVNDFRNYQKKNELYHHGILGQKWGVRRYQNADGTLTEAGKKRYENSSDNKRTLRLTDKQKTALKIGAAVGIGAIAAYAGYRAYQVAGSEFLDHTIKAGSTIQTISRDKQRLYEGKEFFTSFLNSDKRLYESDYGFGDRLHQQYRIQAESVSNLKIASKKSSRDAFISLIKSDADFAKQVLDPNNYRMSTLVSDRYKKETNLLKNIDLKRLDKVNKASLKAAYDIYNVEIPYEGKLASSKEKFYNALKEKGYAGLIDINDTKYSIGATAPTIIFDKNALFTKWSEELDDNTVRKANMIVKGKNFLETMVLPEAMGIPIGLVAAKNFGDKILNDTTQESAPKKRAS